MSIWLNALVYLSLVNNPAFAVEPAALQEPIAARTEDGFITELKFDREVSADRVQVEFINQTVQIDVKDANFSAGKSFKKVSDAQVRSVFTYQSEPGIVRTRVIHHKDIEAKKFKNNIEVNAKNNSVFVTIKNPEGMIKTSQDKDVEALFSDRPPIDLDRELSGPHKNSVRDEDLSSEEEKLLAAAAEMSTDQKGKQNKEKNTEKKSAEKGKTIIEEEIPLTIGTKKVSEEESSPWFRLLLSMGVISVVAIALIVGVKKFSKGHHKVGGSIKVRVVSQHPLGPKKNLTIVNVAGEILLLGVTDHSINMIKSISLIDDELVDDAPVSFDAELNHAQIASAATVHKKITDEAEISLSNIKDRVSQRLKEMRTL